MWESESDRGEANYILGGDQAQAGLVPVNGVRGRDDSSMAASYELYADLLKRAVLNLLFPEQLSMFDEHGNRRWPHEIESLDKVTVGYRKPNIEKCIEGKEIMVGAKTMISIYRLNNIKRQIERVVADDVPGDFLEAGVWRGGACIFATGILNALGDKDRRVFLADSFAGFRPADEARFEIDSDHPFHERRYMTVSREMVEESFRSFGLFGPKVKFIEGWFSESMRDLEEPDKLAILRLDGDLYESHMDVFNALYDRVSPGGAIICDDYNSLLAAHKAVDDFRQQRRITAPIIATDYAESYWIKE